MGRFSEKIVMSDDPVHRAMDDYGHRIMVAAGKEKEGEVMPMKQ